MDDHDIHGGCLCGAVRYRLTCLPGKSTVCHCPDCRRAVGAQAVAWITVPTHAFVITRGSPKPFRSSGHATRTFCGDCGTSLTYLHDGRALETDVTTASLDDPAPYPPTEHEFVEHRIPWATP